MKRSFVVLVTLVVLPTFLVGISMAGAKAPATKGSGWSGAVAISPLLQPDPTRGSQLNDLAVNANGLAIAAWDQFAYSNGGSASIGAAGQSGGKWRAPFTISGVTGFSISPKVAGGAGGTMAGGWVDQNGARAQKKM